jgi:hypothetical protein
MMQEGIDMAQISLLVRINAELPEVYAKVATAQGIAGWFTEAGFKVNQHFGSVRLRLWDEVDFIVTEGASQSRINWHCTSAAHPWLNTDITFGFRAEGEQTVVTFDHSGWSEVTDHFRACAMSWAYFLESLCALVETGEGMPEGVALSCESPLE